MLLGLDTLTQTAAGARHIASLRNVTTLPWHHCRYRLIAVNRDRRRRADRKEDKGKASL
jgi:hypothetical protein